MARLTDPDRLRAYQNALANWRFEGFVQWKQRPAEWVRHELGGFTLRAIAELMYMHVASGGAIDEQPETRKEYSEFEFHHDLRFSIRARRIYIETLLFFDDPDDPVIRVVNIHDQ